MAPEAVQPRAGTQSLAGSSTLPASLPTPRRIILRPGDLVLAADRDDIPPIFAEPDLFNAGPDAYDEWSGEELVVGITIGSESRAYPVRLLSLHEVINDVVGGWPLAITWCPLCYSAIVYERALDIELTFAASGYLYQNNLVMLDHQTETLWSQALGVALRGAQRGDRLRMLPSNLTTLADWMVDYPDTDVLSAKQLGYSQETLFDPYAGYYNSGAAGLTGRSIQDDRVPVKALVAGAAAGGSALAIPLEHLEASTWVQATVDGRPLVISYEAQSGSLRAYLRQVDGQTISFEPGNPQPRDLATASTWDLAQGLALSGEAAGTQLVPYPVILIYWFAWVDLHPETALYSP
jgi:hypothetical protein